MCPAGSFLTRFQNLNTWPTRIGVHVFPSRHDKNNCNCPRSPRLVLANGIRRRSRLPSWWFELASLWQGARADSKGVKVARQNTSRLGAAACDNFGERRITGERLPNTGLPSSFPAKSKRDQKGEIRTSCAAARGCPSQGDNTQMIPSLGNTKLIPKQHRST